MASANYDLSENAHEWFTTMFKGPLMGLNRDYSYKAFNKLRDGYDNSALLVAAGQGCVEPVKFLLKLGANIHDKNVFGKSVLHFASAKGHEAIVNLLLERGADVHAIDKSGNTVLHSAAEGGTVDIASTFLNLGIDLKEKNLANETALQCAAKGSNLEMADFLIKHGADVNERNPCGLTPLLHASEKGSEDLVELLLKHGAEIQAKDSQNSNVLHYAAESGNENLIKLFLNLKIDINEKGFEGITALHLAVRYGNAKAVQLLLDRGASINAQDCADRSALNYACTAGHERIVQLLLDRGALITKDILRFGEEFNNVKFMKQILDSGIDINSLDKEGQTTLHYACEMGYEDIVRLLLTRGPCENSMNFGVDVNKLDRNGQTALHYACKTGSENIVRLLLARGASVTQDNSTDGEPCEHSVNLGVDINKHDKNGQTALHYACKMGHENIVTLLLARGALITEDSFGKTVLHFGAQGGNENIIQLFLDRGIAVGATDKNGSTALHDATKRKNLNAVKLLLDSGANINDERKVTYYSKEYESALIIAILCNFESGVELLLERGASVNFSNYRSDVLLEVDNQNIIKILLDFGLDDIDDSVLANALCKNRSLIAQKLFENGKKLGPTIDFLHCGHYHSMKHHPLDESLQVFLSYGLNVNALNQEGKPLVHYLLYFKNYSAAKIITEHVVKMKNQNLCVNDKVWSVIMNNDVLKTYQKKCDEEIKKMKKEEFYNSTVSCFDVLIAENPQQLVSYARNKDIIEDLGLYEEKKIFPIYFNSLYSQIQRGAWRKLLIEQAGDFFIAVTSPKCTDHQLPKLPATFIHELCNYLTNKELKILTRACKSKFYIDIHDVTKDMIYN